MTRIALFAGSFDPITLGHCDIVQRALKIFDQLIIGVGTSQGKSPYFKLNERMAMIEESVGHFPGVKVAAFSGLSVDFAKSLGASALVRGVRSVQDYSYEIQMAHMNQALDPSLQTVLLATSPLLSHISSTLAKEISSHHGDVRLLVSENVARRFEEKMT